MSAANMLDITNASSVTMSSREIAELTGKKNFHVNRDIRKMLSENNLDEKGYIQTWIDSQNGQQYEEFLLPKDLTITLVAGYRSDLRLKIVRRWMELEATPQQPTLSDRQSKAIAILRAAEEEAAVFIRKRVNDAVLIMQGHDDLVTVPQMPPKLTPKALREAVGMFRSLQYINKLSGMDKNNALLSANRQVRDATGIDLLKNSGATHLLANTTDHPLTPTAIGKRLGEYGAQRINGVLAHLGLQTKKSVGSKEAWVPTTKGEPFAIMEDTSKKSGDGTPIRQLKWRASVIELVRGELSSPVAA